MMSATQMRTFDDVSETDKKIIIIIIIIIIIKLTLVCAISQFLFLYLPLPCSYVFSIYYRNLIVNVFVCWLVCVLSMSCPC